MACRSAPVRVQYGRDGSLPGRCHLDCIWVKLLYSSVRYVSRLHLSMQADLSLSGSPPLVNASFGGARGMAPANTTMVRMCEPTSESGNESAAEPIVSSAIRNK